MTTSAAASQPVTPSPRPKRVAHRQRWGWLRALTHLGACMPFVLLVWDGFHNNLTANPIQDITFRTGKAALVLLLLSLTCTPLNTLFGIRQAIPLRRPLGLWAFFYATLHLLTFAVVDYGLDWGQIQQAIVEKRYVLVGFTAFLLLLPLAVTSTKGWQRRMGRRWIVLHRAVYLAAMLAIVHFVWEVKADIREPLAYGVALAILLALRMPFVRRPLTRLRHRILGPHRRTEQERVISEAQGLDSTPS